LRQGRTWDERLSNLPKFTRFFDCIRSSLKKIGCNIRDRLPLDRHFRPDGKRDSTSVTQPRLQEVDGDKPRCSSASSIVSDVALVTNPHTEPPTIVLSPVSTLPELAAIPNQEQESLEHSAGGETPSAPDSAGLRTAGSRTSQVSGRSLSIMTLPSFLTNDPPQTYSSSIGAQIESPIRPNNYHHKQSSIFDQRLSGTESVPQISPAHSEDTGGKRSRPTPGSLQIITSALKRSSSAASSVRSCSPSSRRSSRRSLGRSNLSPGSEDEAVAQWKRLPPLHPVQVIHTTQPPQSRAASGIEEFSTERLFLHREIEPGSPIFLAAYIPLPPSPSTSASSVSSLTYAPPSPEGIPPINDFMTPYASYPPLPPFISPSPRKYPPLPPSVPPLPRQFSCPPTPNSTDRFVDAHTVHRADRAASLAISTPRSSPNEVGGAQPNLNTLTTVTNPIPVLPGKDSGFLPYGPNNDATTYRRNAPAYSRHSSVQELVLPSPSLFGPPPTMSPGGPRPLPLTPGQLSRSVTLCSRASSTGR
jgi:hypothetical protein